MTLPPSDRFSDLAERPRRFDPSILTMAGAIVIFFGVAIASVVQLDRTTEESNWVAHTHEVMDTLGDGRERALDLRRASDRRILAVDSPKLDAIDATIKALRALTKDNPAQQERLDLVDAATGRLRVSPNAADADLVIATMSEMRLHERELLQERKRRVLTATDRTRAFVLGGNFVALALVAYAVFASRRDAKERVRAQKLAEARQADAERQTRVAEAKTAEAEDLRKIADDQRGAAEALAVEANGLRKTAEAERAIADEKTREAEELYNHAPCGYHVSRLPDLVYDRVNDTELAWLGYTRDELVGKRKFSEFLTEESRARVESTPIEQRFLPGAAPLELEVVRRDGTTFFVNVAASPTHDADGSVTGWMTTLFDIDAQKRAALENERLHEELEARAVSLETVNKDLEAFSYSISHDLRAPLRAIGGFARILEEDHAEVLGPEGRRVLGVVRSNTSRMSQLVDDLLAFSRLGRKSVARTDVDMKRLTEEVVEELRNQTGSLPAEVEIGELPPAHADPRLVRQVLVNLVSNAVKYSANKPEPRVQVSSTREDGEPVYHVKDNGAGFDMQGYDKMFGVFQRLHRQEEFPGTGVGLAIAHRVVAKHGGRIWAAGKVGEGAEFHFTLPKESAR